MEDFISKSLILLHNEKDRFLRYYVFACKVWADEVMPPDVDDPAQSRDMTNRTKRLKFSGFLSSLHRDLDVHERMLEKKQKS